MKEKKIYMAPEIKVYQIKTESVLLTGSPQGLSNESYTEGSIENWF